MSFQCTECSRELPNKTAWEDHMTSHTFEKGFVCPDPDCFEYIPKEKISFARLHCKLAHEVAPKAAQQVAEDKMNRVTPWTGIIWCKPCKEIKSLGGNASPGGISPEALAHHASHLPE
ncbi:uncharacterized protein BDV14DRAFT_185828 [Aspergillus stella-maris]|uniref:uncharacterized protein n=1 Tax=Aspergillus stella-maris TaxID=1810926 RepID=UPI003CCE09AD